LFRVSVEVLCTGVAFAVIDREREVEEWLCLGPARAGATPSFGRELLPEYGVIIQVGSRKKTKKFKLQHFDRGVFGIYHRVETNG